MREVLYFVDSRAVKTKETTWSARDKAIVSGENITSLVAVAATQDKKTTLKI